MVRYIMMIMFCLVGCDAVLAGPAIDFNRAIYINKEIDDKILPLGDKLLEYTLKGPKNEGWDKAVHVIINSPGGDTVNGFWFIDVMREVRARGVMIKCYVPRMAASMAFQILLHCDERYALPQAVLLWHRVRAMFLFFVATGPAIASLAEDLSKQDALILADLKAHLPTDEATLMHHLERETLHTASQLNDIVPRWLSVGRVPGLLQVPDSVPHMEEEKQMFMFGGQNNRQQSGYRIRYLYEVPTMGE